MRSSSAWYDCGLVTPIAGYPRSGRAGCARPSLPAIVGERLVRVGHAVRVFLLLHRVAFAPRREDDLRRQLLRHRLLVAVARELDEPAHRQRRATVGPHFHRHLVRRATHAAALHLDRRFEVAQRLLEDVHAGLVRPLLHEIHRVVENPLRGGLLPLVHHRVDELGDGLAVVARVGEDRTLYGGPWAAPFFPPPLGVLGATL